MHAAAPSVDNSLCGLPLILLPGTLCDRRIFDALWQRLSLREAQVIVTPYASSMEAAAEQVLAQAPPQFALLGFSLGGMIGMETALRAPERVRGLALLSTTPLAVPAERHAARREAIQTAASMPMRRFVREHLWPEYGGGNGDATTLSLLEQMAEALGPTAFACQTSQALGRSDFCPRLPAITCPTLIVAGALDALCPPAAQQQLAEAIPHATSIMLPNAGHFALLEQPDEIASAVAAWFNTLTAPAHNAEPGVHHGTTHQSSRETE